MKYFVFTDCHGNFDALKDALRIKGYDCHNPEHQLIGLGDYFGRATQYLFDNYCIWKYLTSSQHSNPPVCLRGNHETILMDAIRRGYLSRLDILNGELATFCSFGAQMAAENNTEEYQEPYYEKKLAFDRAAQQQICSFMGECGFEEWLYNLPWYHITPTHLFVHGFVPQDIGEIPAEVHSDNDWYKCSWAVTPTEIDLFAAKHPGGIDHTIVFGHWRADELNNMFFGGDWPMAASFNDTKHKLLGLDYTTVVSGEVGCAVIEDNAGDQKFDKKPKLCYNKYRKKKKENDYASNQKNRRIQSGLRRSRSRTD